MLDKHCPVSLNHSQVNDTAYLDAATLLIAARERLGKRDGGMVAFSAVSGELRYRFRVAHDRQVKSFTASMLAFDQDSRIFASCKGRLNEYSINVWDYVTGEQANFFCEQPGCALGDADKLQWLDATNALMVWPRCSPRWTNVSSACWTSGPRTWSAPGRMPARPRRWTTSVCT
jgi:hypothetical protein